MAAKKRILLIEDEADILTTVKMRLEAEGYEVITASDGQQGYIRAKIESPDLIILDLMLPGMDGYKVCRLLKFDQKYSHIPIMILTARAQKEDRQLGEEVGADCYLTKPFSAKELLDKIEELVNK
jgi:DNA-binding response OmpR family regulator